MNTYASGNQAIPRIKELSNGNILAAWSSERAGSTGYDIRWQLFDQKLNKLGKELEISDSLMANYNIHIDFLELSSPYDLLFTWEGRLLAKSYSNQNGDAEVYQKRVSLYFLSGTCVAPQTDYCVTSGNQCVNPSTYCPSGKNCISIGTDYCTTLGNQCVNPNTFSPPGKLLCTQSNIYSNTVECGEQKYVALNKTQEVISSTTVNCGNGADWTSWGVPLISGIGGTILGAIGAALIKKHCGGTTPTNPYQA